MTARPSAARTAVDPMTADAALFDLDGVLTDTAAVHRRAWAELFAGYLAGAAPTAPPYTDADYYALVDGRARIDGVRAVLASRGLNLPEGTPDDPPSADTVHGLSNRKNAAFTRILDRDGAIVFPGSVRLLRALHAAGVPMAVVSSSKNARTILRRTRLLAYFAEVVDGVLAADRGIPGKPAPDMFATAARLVSAAPARTVAFEDAVSGVRSARASGCWVIGVARGVGAAELAAAGADRVVSDPGDLLRA